MGGKVEELWRKRFVEKMSFESGVEVRRSNGCNGVVDCRPEDLFLFLLQPNLLTSLLLLNLYIA